MKTESSRQGSLSRQGSFNYTYKRVYYHFTNLLWFVEIVSSIFVVDYFVSTYKLMVLLVPLITMQKRKKIAL